MVILLTCFFRTQWTPLGLAIQKNDAALVELLLSAGAGVKTPFVYDGKQYTPLDFAKSFKKKSALAALKTFMDSKK